MTRDPVAWRTIQPGWGVVDSEGNVIGKVDQVTGDLDGDIFNGITVGDGGTVYTRARYVPSEQVAKIYQGEVVLNLSADEAAKLEPYHQVVSERLAELAPEVEQPRPGSFGGLLNSNWGLGNLLRALFFMGRFP